MAAVPLRVVVVLLIVVIACGLGGLVLVGTGVASDGIEDVTLSLVEQIAERVTEKVLLVVREPFQGLAMMQETYNTGLVNPERWDAMYYADALRYEHTVIQSMEVGISNMYTSNEYGHMNMVFRMRSDGHFLFATSPSHTQMIEGSPTWTIPCRYQRNCTNESNSLNHNYCVNQSDPWVGNYGKVPFWARGNGSYLGPVYAASYPVTDPEYATWAVAQNPTGADRTYCRPSAQSAKQFCPDGRGCPEFNLTYFTYKEPDDSADDLVYLQSKVSYDPRQRGWYDLAKSLPPNGKSYTDVYICASSPQPCLTALQPLYVYVPQVGATVVVDDGQTGVVSGYTHTHHEMHTPVVLLGGGSTEVISRHRLSLACMTDCSTTSVANTTAQITVANYIGAIAADYYVAELTEIGRWFKAGKTGGVFIADFTDEALLLTSRFPCEASERGERCFQRKTPEGTNERVSVFDSYSGEIVSNVARSLFEPQQDPLTGRWVAWKHKVMMEMQDEVVSFGGSSYWVRLRRIKPSGIRNFDWWVCVVIPQDDYLQEVERRQVVTFAVSLSLLVVLLIVLLVLTMVFFLKPISRMIQDFESACLMQLDEIEYRDGGVVRELALLQESFNVLATNLRIYRPFLPPSCFGFDVGPNDREDVLCDDATLSSESSSTTESNSSSGTSVCSNSTWTLKAQVKGGLKRKMVTIMAANIHGFSLMAPQLGVETLLHRHASFVSAMLVLAGPKAVAEAFSGDRMVFSFNALVPQVTTDVPFKAALSLAKLRFEGRPLHIGLSHSEVMCGAMGTSDSMMKFSLIGPCYGASIILMTLNKQYPLETGVAVIIDDACRVKAVLCHFIVAFLDCFHMPKLCPQGDRVKLWRLVEELVMREQEWMYQYQKVEDNGDNQWEDFLMGLRSDFTDPRIKELIAKGVHGPAYVAPDPGIMSLCA